MKADDHPPEDVGAAIEAFLLSRRVANCSAGTSETYERNLRWFERPVGVAQLQDIMTLAVQRYLVRRDRAA